jgi:hypothetical protein
VSHLVVIKGVNNCWFYLNGATSLTIGDEMGVVVGTPSNSFTTSFAGIGYSVKFYNQLLSAEEVESTKHRFGL